MTRPGGLDKLPIVPSEHRDLSRQRRSVGIDEHHARAERQEGAIDVGGVDVGGKVQSVNPHRTEVTPQPIDPSCVGRKPVLPKQISSRSYAICRLDYGLGIGRDKLPLPYELSLRRWRKASVAECRPKTRIGQARLWHALMPHSRIPTEIFFDKRAVAQELEIPRPEAHVGFQYFTPDRYDDIAGGHAAEH
jgi:hypothetical protein